MRDEVSHLCHTALRNMARPAGLEHVLAEHREARHVLESAGPRPTRNERVGAPGRARTCDPRLRRDASCVGRGFLFRRLR
jgi:hypothetical protein